MNKKELKKAIKPIVREALLEVLTEDFMKTLVKEVVKVSPRSTRESSPKYSLMNLHENRPQVDPSEHRRRSLDNMQFGSQDKKKELRERVERSLGLEDDNPYKGIYEDIIENDVDGVINEANGNYKEPDEVSMEQLASMGLAKDFSKLI